MTAYERNQIVRELLRTLDRHSDGELEHAERVAVYATAIAHRLGYDSRELVRIRLAAQLHDVGKTRVDAQLLRKVGRLTTDELREIRLHSALATGVVERFEFLRDSLPGIREHHEWWDGSGYPDGLVGEAIDLDARIIGVAEAFDVLCHGSPWREAEVPDDAMIELERSSGTQFDPRVVRALDDVREIIQPLGQAP